MSFIDEEFHPLTSATSGPVMGLVVGIKKSEAEFMAAYGGPQKLPMAVIEFEGDDDDDDDDAGAS
jgi:hypothetical protein